MFRDHDQNLETEPPDQQQRKIQPTEAGGLLVDTLGAQGSGPRGTMCRKSHEIPRAQLRHLSSKHDLVEPQPAGQMPRLPRAR